MRPAGHTKIAEPPAPAGGWLGLTVDFLGVFRWAFLPLGLLALVGMGIHTAADLLDDRVLALVERGAAALGSWSLMESWSEGFGAREQTHLARLVALVWELSADLLLALPVLGYRERTRKRDEAQRFVPPFLFVRPLAAASACLAGALAVARMVRGAFYLSFHELLGDSLAGVGSRTLALGVLAAVLGTLGWRAVVASFRHAQRLSRESAAGPRALGYGLPSAVLLSPLAVAALVEAAPILSLLS